MVTPDNSKQRFTLPSANVDISTLTVKVQVSTSNTFSTVYTQSKDITEVTANSNIFYVEENPSSNGSYTVQFGDGVLGRKLANNNLVIVNYLDTQGSGANQANNFSIIDDIDGYSANIAVVSSGAASAGTDKETIEQIRFRAPRAYTAQNRIVTVDDYETILLKDYPYIESIAVWGGEEEADPIYGKVYISLKPKENYYITLDEKERIKNEIIKNRSVLTVTPEIVDPDYNYMIISADIDYDASITNLDSRQIAALARASVLDYKENELQLFSSVFRGSTLQNYINGADQSILGNTIKVFLQKRLEITPNEVNQFTLKFNTRLQKGEPAIGLYTFPAVQIMDMSNVQRDIYFEEVPRSFTGIDRIEILNKGFNYTRPPTITITGDGSGAVANTIIVNGQVETVDIINRGSNYTRAEVTSSGDGSGFTARAILQSRNGTLRAFYYKQNGEKFYINENAGTIDYDTGIIVLNAFIPVSTSQNPNYIDNILTVNIQPEKPVIYPIHNRILDIDENDASSILVKVNKV